MPGIVCCQIIKGPRRFAAVADDAKVALEDPNLSESDRVTIKQIMTSSRHLAKVTEQMIEIESGLPEKTFYALQDFATDYEESGRAAVLQIIEKNYESASRDPQQ